MPTSSRTRIIAGALSLAVCGCGSEGGADGSVQPAANRAASPDDASPRPPAVSLELGDELRAAFALIARQQNEAARARLSIYLDGHPDDARAEFLMGLSFHRQKRYALARPHFERAIELEPGYHPAYHFYGWCLYWLGDLPASRRAFENHLAYLPDEGDSHFAIGLIDLDEDRLDEARARFLHAIELQADDPGRRKDVAKAHARLADIHIRRNELVEAKARLQRATELWPEHYTAFYKLHRVLTRLGETEAAQEALRLYEEYEKRVTERRGIPGSPP